MIDRYWSLNVLPRAFTVSKDDHRKVEAILRLESQMAKLSDQQLRDESAKLQEKISQGEETETFIETAFALVRAASERTTGMKHYKVQLLAGMHLARGAIAEVATGEGKTLTATLPVYLWALHGRGVHVITVNQYLAERDYESMRPIYEFLGLSVGVLGEKDTDPQKQ